MKVLLVNPPWKKAEGVFGVRAGSRWPFTVPAASAAALPYVPFPFFLAYAAALLERESGLTVSAIDAIAEGLEERAYLDRVAAFAPDVILAETATASWTEDARLARAVKELAPEARLFLAGPHVSSFADKALASVLEVEACLVGEYEWTLRDLIRVLREHDRVPEDMPGLAVRDGSGGVRVNPRRALGDLDELPWPAWHHFPMLNYKDYFCSFPRPMVNMVASRGCPFRCNFCLWPEVMYGGHAYRVRQMSDVVDEMAALVTRYGFKTFYFDDDTFNIGKARLLEFASLVRARKLDVSLAVMARADTMDAETLAALKAAGLHAIKYGVESGSQRVLDLAGKSLDLATVRRTVADTKALGVKVHLTFTVGLRGETLESLRQTRELALELAPDSLQLSYATPFPGTRYHKYARENGFLLTDDETLFDGAQGCVVRTEDLEATEVEAGFHAFRAAWEDFRKNGGTKGNAQIPPQTCSQPLATVRSQGQQTRVPNQV